MVLDRGFAYEAGGAVYFDVSKFDSFGSISHYTEDEMIELARPAWATGSTTRTAAPARLRAVASVGGRRAVVGHDVGSGSPGWHLECSALALRELGTTIDLHGGGTDLIFPHHECERAQSEAATGEPFVRHWMHTALISKDGAKMSKSLGNLVFVDKLRTEYDPMAIRLALIEHQYRTEWEWDDELTPRNVSRLAAWRANADGRPGDVIDEVRERLDDDLDSPGAVAAIDRAAARGESTAAAAALLGVELT